MEQEKINEGNILIAEFMCPSIEWNDSRKGKIRLYSKIGESPNCEIHELKYHCSWNWLMPVVGKISKTLPMNQSWFDVKYRLIEADISGCFIAVVNFIAWHNSQKTKEAI